MTRKGLVFLTRSVDFKHITATSSSAVQENSSTTLYDTLAVTDESYQRDLPQLCVSNVLVAVSPSTVVKVKSVATIK